MENKKDEEPLKPHYYCKRCKKLIPITITGSGDWSMYCEHCHVRIYKISPQIEPIYK